MFLSRRTPPHIVTLMCMAGLSALAMNVFLPSLPGMTAWFDSSAAVMGLSVGVYLFVNGVIQLIIGPVSDKYGRRPVVLWGIGFYLLATLGCIFSPTAAIFLSFRMLQATVATAMVLSRAIVRDTTPAEEAGSRVAYVTMGMAIVPMIGPAIGGFLEQSFGWHANFWMLFGAGLAIWVLVWADLGETTTPSGNTLTQQFREYPELLTSPRFWGYCLASACASGAFFAFLGGAPFISAQVFDLSPHEFGMYFAAPSVGYFVGNFLSGRYSQRIGINRMVLWGLVITALAMVVGLGFSALGLMGANLFFACMVPLGIGNGMTIPNATAGMLSVRPHLAGTASGLGGAIMLGGGAGLSALSGVILPGVGSAAPLLWIMGIVSVLGIVAILIVMRRERHILPQL